MNDDIKLSIVAFAVEWFLHDTNLGIRSPGQPPACSRNAGSL